MIFSASCSRAFSAKVVRLDLPRVILSALGRADARSLVKVRVDWVGFRLVVITVRGGVGVSVVGCMVCRICTLGSAV